MILDRHLESTILQHSKRYPIISIVGPRQSGKTTLTRKLFPKHEYLSLENLDLRQQAGTDPRGFLNDHPSPLILDEVQRVPDLFSYLQEIVDVQGGTARYVLTGSQQFLLIEKITQSLAGRIINFHLFPFTFTEIKKRRTDSNVPTLFQPKPSLLNSYSPKTLMDLLVTGFYPRIHDKKLDAQKWLENYLLTYVERDIRSIVNVSDLRTFENFLKVCASNSGQLLNLNSIGSAVGISQPTAKRWISLLESSGIIFLLSPHTENFRKRIVKSPKLYFMDTGLLCFLLSIKGPLELKFHPLYGAIFETFIIAEFYKRIAHLGERPPLYFWRDKIGNEIDLLVDLGNSLLPIEIKSSQTYSPSFQNGIQKWCHLPKNSCKSGFVLYNGRQIFGKDSAIPTLPWWCL